MLEDLIAQIQTYYAAIVELLPKLGLAIIFIGLFLMVTRFIRRRFIKYIKSRAADPLLVNFVNDIIRFVNVTIAVFFFLYIVGLGSLASTVLGAAGLSAFIIGFAFRDIGENFLAGILLAFNRPFRIGDVLKSGEIEGSIIDINLRETHIKTFDGKDVYVPNGQILKNPLFNYTIDGFLQKSFLIGVDYGYDLPMIIEEMDESIRTVKGVLSDEKNPSVTIKEFADSYILFQIKYWIDTFDKSIGAIQINNNAMNAILTRMGELNINLPGNVIELKNYNSKAFAHIG